MTPKERAARNEKIIAYFYACRSGPWIARKFSMSPSAVYVVLWKAGLTAKDGGERVRCARYAEPPAQSPGLRDLLRKHHFLNALYPPYPREASHAGHRSFLARAWRRFPVPPRWVRRSFCWLVRP